MAKTPNFTATNPSTPGYVRVSGRAKSSPMPGDIFQVSIGDKMIPVTEAIITIKPGELVTMQLKTHPECVDIEALEENTELKIVKE